MSILEKYNKGKSTVMDGVDTEGWDFVKLVEFAGRRVPTKGFFFTKGKYGKSVVVVGESVLINMPSWCVDTFEEMKNDPETMALILAGKVALDNIIKKSTKNGNDTVSFDFVEI